MSLYRAEHMGGLKAFVRHAIANHYAAVLHEDAPFYQRCFGKWGDVEELRIRDGEMVLCAALWRLWESQRLFRGFTPMLPFRFAPKLAMMDSVCFYRGLERCEQFGLLRRDHSDKKAMGRIYYRTGRVVSIKRRGCQWARFELPFIEHLTGLPEAIKLIEKGNRDGAALHGIGGGGVAAGKRSNAPAVA